MLAEENEEILETWYFKHQEIQPNLEKTLCIDKLKRCCANGYWGSECTECPGLISLSKENKTVSCFGKGICNVSFLKDINFLGKLKIR